MISGHRRDACRSGCGGDAGDKDDVDPGLFFGGERC